VLAHKGYSCKDCIVSFLETCTAKGEDGRCPTCSKGPLKVCACAIVNCMGDMKRLLQESDLLELIQSNHAVGSQSRSQVPSSEVKLRKNDFRSSTKLEALVQNLRKPWHCAYSLVFLMTLSRSPSGKRPKLQGGCVQPIYKFPRPHSSCARPR
jgi:hypothetical protein